MKQQQTKKRTTRAKTGSEDNLYTLDVFIMSGPIAQSFAKKNKVISRTIQIHGDQTLEELHHAIFDAFDREEEHMYEFQIGGKGPMDPQARRYVLPVGIHDLEPEGQPAENVKRTKIGSLGLRVKDVFGYWFDLGSSISFPT